MIKEQMNIILIYNRGKYIKICLSTYYAKQNTRGIPLLLISGGILATLLEQVSQRVLLPKNGRMLLLFLVIGILVLIDKKVKNHS